MAKKHKWFPEELAAAKPPERITISEWACKYRELGKLSAITGLYSLDITPFFGPIMDRCCSPDIDEQYLCAPAQIGKTVAVVENPAAYYLHQDPSSIMVCLADEDTATFVAVEKIANIFKDSAALSSLYDKKNFNRDVIDTPNGGHIDFAWASSVAKLASRPERIVIADEVDKPGYYKKSKEASAISLLKERTKSYPDGYYKHIFLSTPTIPEGNIIVLLDSADIILDWRVPCPYCGQRQPLRWSSKYCHGFKDYKYRGDDGELHNFGMVVWEGGRKATKEQIAETARYQCGDCGEHWTTLQKNEAVRHGIEVTRDGRIISHATKGLNPGERKIGNHINRIYSTVDSGRLEKLVQEWVDIFKLTGEQQIGALKGFVNSALAEPFQQVINVSNESDFMQAKCSLPAQTVPHEAVALTCFVDVQKYGFWFCVRAFARDYTSWLIHYGHLTTWEDVGVLLFETYYPVQDSTTRTMRIWRAAVDTGGGEKYTNMSMTEETYWWLRENAIGRGCRVWGTKGASSPFPGKIRVGKPLDKTPSGKPLPGGLQIIQLNTDDLKDAFFYRLKQAGAGGIRGAYLHKDTGKDYIRQITAEEKQITDKGTIEWVQIRKDNHYLDCEIGAMVLAEPEWIGGGVDLLPAYDETPRPQTRPVVKSKWMSR